MRSLLDMPMHSVPLAQAFDPWAYTNEIRLVVARFQFKGCERSAYHKIRGKRQKP
jgi:hypothetical protein